MSSHHSQSIAEQTMSPGSIIRYSSEPEFQQLLERLIVTARPSVTEVGTADRLAPDVATTTDRIPKKCGRFQIEQLLGKGSFGTVYLAFDPLLNRHVALKVAYPKPGLTLQRLISEARVAAQLVHAGIVTVFEVGHTDAELYIAMEHVTGGTLRDFMAKEQTLSERLRVVREIAEAIHEAHKKGVTHRDLKPENIMMTSELRPKIADFGLAVASENDSTLAGQIAGAPPYMSPEQTRGDADLLDGRTDIWALGVILYELLLGRRPFKGVGEELDREIRLREARPLRQVDDSISKDLERATLKCLEKRPVDRFSTALDLAREIRRIERPQRRKVMWLASILLLVIVGIGLWLGFYFERGPAEFSRYEAIGLEHRLLDRELNPVYLPARDANPCLFSSPRQGTFWVSCDGKAMFQTGATDAVDFELNVTIDMRGWNDGGSAGLFLGLADTETGSFCECIQIKPVMPTRSDRFEVVRRSINIQSSDIRPLCDPAYVKLRPRGNKLKVRVFDGRVAQVLLNGELLDELSHSLSPSVVGMFGLIHHGGDSIFTMHTYEAIRGLANDNGDFL
ncbi:MAG: serine/threonine-protein kinase [Planctomycetota bacterium]